MQSTSIECHQEKVILKLYASVNTIPSLQKATARIYNR
jgi:hypothetical protein